MINDYASAMQWISKNKASLKVEPVQPIGPLMWVVQIDLTNGRTSIKHTSESQDLEIAILEACTALDKIVC